MKLYGSLNNRFEENCYFNNTLGNIKVGTHCTIYYWSDRHAYEVIEVKSQENVVIRRLKAIRTDNFGMSDAQDYRYESNPNAKAEEIKLTKNGWREVEYYTKANFEKCLENSRKDCNTEEGAKHWAEFIFKRELTDKQFEKMMAGKDITKLGQKVNISFGVADEYFDYSF